VLADDTSEEEREQFQVLCIAIGLALSAILHGLPTTTLRPDASQSLTRS
jgi:hypothetical protein